MDEVGLSGIEHTVLRENIKGEAWRGVENNKGMLTNNGGRQRGQVGECRESGGGRMRTRKERRKERRKGGREEGRKGGREEGRKGGREEGRKGGREEGVKMGGWSQKSG